MTTKAGREQGRAARRVTAPEQYRENRKRVRRAEQALAALLDQHAKKQAARPFDWGLPGDLGHVAEVLEEAVRFLGGEVRTYEVFNQNGRRVRVTVPPNEEGR